MRSFRFMLRLNGAIYGAIAALLLQSPTLAASRITVALSPLEFSLPVRSLEAFARQGKIDSDLRFYSRFATPEQLAQLRQLLQLRLPLTPTALSQVTYTPLGEALLRQSGALVQTEGRQNGFYALRSALILAADDPGGLTVLNVLRRFPGTTMRVDLTAALRLRKALTARQQQWQQTFATIDRQASQSAAANPLTAPLPDLRQPGAFAWQTITLDLRDDRRDRLIRTDVYLPQVPAPRPTSLPVVVLSHGFGADQTALAYLAKHLASYGFAVVVPDHPGVDLRWVQQFLAGLALPPDPHAPIDQPLDITFVLNQLQQMSVVDPRLQALNLQRVGVIGHSAGGAAALALGGAQPSALHLQQDCPQANLLNLPLLVLCNTVRLPAVPVQLKDDRIQAIFAINPLTAALFGTVGLHQVRVPTLLIAGSDDLVAPAVPEQIRPFAEIAAPEKYLGLIAKATHTAALDPDWQQSVLRLPGSTDASDAATRSYLRALSVAFMQTYLENRPAARAYLTAAYGRSIGQPPYTLSLVR